MPRNFITNAKQKTLKNRIQTLIQHSQELKFLVGFFYFSGWRELYQALKQREDLTIKILVGLDTDLRLGQVLEVANPDAANATQQELVGRFFVSLRTALQDEALDTQEFYEQVTFFLGLLESGRLQIRKTFDPNHAKLYLFRLDEAGKMLVNAPGRFITGSSNLTRAGLLGQQEFNVEIGDYGWDDAEAYFDELWESSIPLSELPDRREQILRIIRRQTQVAEISPFEAYALVLKTYLDLMEQKALRPQVKRLMESRGYKVYRYQEEAVQPIRRRHPCGCGGAWQIGHRQLAGAGTQRPWPGYLPAGTDGGLPNQIQWLVQVSQRLWPVRLGGIFVGWIGQGAGISQRIR